MHLFRFAMTTPERGQRGPPTRTTYLAVARVDGQNVIVTQDRRHLLCCSVAYRMHVYIADRLFGSMLTNGIVSAADLLYAEVMLYILLICPLQPGRERIICKHKRRFILKMF